MTEEEQASRGERVEQFLKDEAVQEVLAKLEKKYYEEFKQARTAEGRESAHAKALVLDDFTTSVRAIVDTGKLARASITRRQRGK